MPRQQLEPGQPGKPSYTPQVRDENGKYKRLNGRGKPDRVRVQCNYRDLNGVFGKIDKTAPNLNKAQTLLEAELKKVRSGSQQTSEHVTETTPFLSVVRHWMSQAQRPEANLSPRSISDYRRNIKKHIEEPGPALGEALKEKNADLRDLCLIQVNDVQRLTRYLQAVADVHGTATAKVCRSILGNILNMSVAYGALTMSALKNVPQVASATVKELAEGEEARDTRRALEEDERAHLIAHADAVANPEGPADPRTGRKWTTAADLLAFMAGTGTRVSEARTLQWDTVHIDGQCGCDRPDLPHAIVKGKGSRGKPKYRRVSMGRALAARLRRRREATSGQGFAFSSPTYLDDDHEWDQSNCAKALDKLIHGAGYGWATPHSLRRTWATTMHKRGVPTATISSQLGHGDIAVTERVYIVNDFMGARPELTDFLD